MDHLKVNGNADNGMDAFYVSPIAMRRIMAETNAAYNACFEPPFPPVGSLMKVIVRACRNDQELAAALVMITTSFVIDATKSHHLVGITDITPDRPSES